MTVSVQYRFFGAEMVKNSIASRAETTTLKVPVSYRATESLSAKPGEEKYTLAFDGSVNGLYSLLQKISIAAVEQNIPTVAFAIIFFLLKSAFSKG